MLLKMFHKSQIPDEWLNYVNLQKMITPLRFIENLSRRVEQCINCNKSVDVKQFPVWVGGLFDPLAYLTATRQVASENSGLSLEKLKLICELDCSENQTTIFPIRNLQLHGAHLRKSDKIEFNMLEVLELSDNIEFNILEKGCLIWRETNKRDLHFKIPVFVNEDRETILFFCSIKKTQLQNSPQEIMKRGVIMIA
jgi:dynein heavy chain 1